MEGAYGFSISYPERNQGNVKSLCEKHTFFWSLNLLRRIFDDNSEISLQFSVKTHVQDTH